jgi:hypothetical protein
MVSENFLKLLFVKISLICIFLAKINKTCYFNNYLSHMSYLLIKWNYIWNFSSFGSECVFYQLWSIYSNISHVGWLVGSSYNIMDLVCYTYFHWFFNPERQHIFWKQMGYIFQFPKTIKTWTTKHYTSLNKPGMSHYIPCLTAE